MDKNKKQVIPRKSYRRQRREFFHNEEREERVEKQRQEERIQAKKDEYQAKVNEFNTTQQSLQTKVQSSLQTMNTTFENRVKQAAEQLRKENNLDFILNKNSTIASDAQYDLTDKMIQKVNAMK